MYGWLKGSVKHYFAFNFCSRRDRETPNTGLGLVGSQEYAKYLILKLE